MNDRCTSARSSANRALVCGTKGREFESRWAGQASITQWIECQPSKLKVGGSSPSRRAKWNGTEEVMESVC